MSMRAIGITLCVVMLLVCIVAEIVKYETRRDMRKLPRPQADERDWSGAFMRDVKRWTR